MEKRPIQTGNELDYVLVPAKLRSLVSHKTVWSVPFRPHAAVFQTLHWREGQVPVLQLDRQMMQPQQVSTSRGVGDARRDLSQDELSNLPQFTAAQERARKPRGRKSRQVTVSRRPLLEPQSQGWVWAGNVAGLARIGVLLPKNKKS